MDVNYFRYVGSEFKSTNLEVKTGLFLSQTMSFTEVFFFVKKMHQINRLFGKNTIVYQTGHLLKL